MEALANWASGVQIVLVHIHCHSPNNLLPPLLIKQSKTKLTTVQLFLFSFLFLDVVYLDQLYCDINYS